MENAKKLGIAKEYAEKTGAKGVFYIPVLQGYYATVFFKDSNVTIETGTITSLLSDIVLCFNEKVCVNRLPFLVNNEEYSSITFDEVLGYAIYDYLTFTPAETSYFYSQNELHTLNEVIRYQKEMNAVLELVKAKNLSTTDVELYTHTKIKSILNKKHKKNRGIYYVPSLLGYTSTHLYENYEKQAGSRIGAGCNYKKIRKFGALCDIVPETLRLFDDTKVKFFYPYAINGIKGYVKSIEDLYKMVVKHPYELTLIRDKYYYSRQVKRNIKYLRAYQIAALEGNAR